MGAVLAIPVFLTPSGLSKVKDLNEIVEDLANTVKVKRSIVSKIVAGV